MLIVDNFVLKIKNSIDILMERGCTHFGVRILMFYGLRATPVVNYRATPFGVKTIATVGCQYSVSPEDSSSIISSEIRRLFEEVIVAIITCPEGGISMISYSSCRATR